MPDYTSNCLALPTVMWLFPEADIAVAHKTAFTLAEEELSVQLDATRVHTALTALVRRVYNCAQHYNNNFISFP